MSPHITDSPTGQQNLAPGSLARLTAAFLGEAGMGVQKDGELDLIVSPGPGTPAPEADADADRWTLTVDDNAYARLCFVSREGEATDPARIVNVTAALFSGNPVPVTPSAPDGVRGTGLMSTAGLALRRRGFSVRLNSFVDDAFLDLCADLSVTVPAIDERDTGTTYITDDGGIRFERSYWLDHAATEWEPEYRTWLPDPAAPARAIADTITTAIRAALREHLNREALALPGRDDRCGQRQ